MPVHGVPLEHSNSKSVLAAWYVATRACGTLAVRLPLPLKVGKS
jgi:hypothetical protein